MPIYEITYSLNGLIRVMRVLAENSDDAVDSLEGAFPEATIILITKGGLK